MTSKVQKETFKQIQIRFFKYYQVNNIYLEKLSDFNVKE